MKKGVLDSRVSKKEGLDDDNGGEETGQVGNGDPSCGQSRLGRSLALLLRCAACASFGRLGTPD